MASAFIEIAPLLGYRASMFNLVFENNLASIRLWKSLNFKEIGRVPNAGYLIRNRTNTIDQSQLNIEEEYVDAIMFYYSFT
jgi:L-amino acid N-acyltransferase YncA